MDPLNEIDVDRLRSRRSVKWRAYPPDVLPMWVAEMDTALAEPIRDALRAAVDAGDVGYESPGQLPDVYADFSLARFGWRPNASHIQLVPDVLHGIVTVLRAFTRPGDGVVINPPVYHPFFPFLELAERRVVENPLVVDANGRYRIDLDLLARDLADPSVTAYLLCNPHNPTGTVLSRDDLVAIKELAARHGVRMLADEVHSPMTYPGHSHVPFLSLPGTEDAIAFVSASKGWNLPGLKAALAIAGDAAAPALRRLPPEAFFGAGLLGVIASEVAFRDCVPWLDALMAGLDANRRVLADLLADYLPDVRYRLPEATYLAWLDCRALGLPADPAEVFLEKGRVAVNSGPTFGEPGRGHVRLNFATAPELLADGVRRMAASL